MNARRDLVVIIAVSILAGMAYAASHRQHLFEDSPDYIIAGYNLASGRGLMRLEPPRSAEGWYFVPRDTRWMLNDIQGDVETARTPIYPLFLALFRLLGLKPDAAIVVQHALRILIAAASYLLAWRVTRRRVVAVMTGLWIAVEPHGLWAANHIGTETLFTAILFAAVWLTMAALKECSVSANGIVIVGFLGALATLTRPVSIAWPVLIVLAIFFTCPRRILLITLLALAYITPLLLWSARNQRAAGIFRVSLISSMSRLFFTAAGGEAMNRPGDFEANLVRIRDEYRERVARETKARSARLGRTLSPAERLALYDAEASRQIRANAGGVIRHFGWRLRLMFVPTYRCSTCGIRGYAKDVLVGLHLVVAVLASFGFIALLRVDAAAALFLASTIAYFALVTAAGGASDGRFRVPIEPYYALLTVSGGAVFVDRWRASRVTS